MRVVIYDYERGGAGYVAEKQTKDIILLPEARTSTATSVNCCVGI